jgi:hypothetical protein
VRALATALLALAVTLTLRAATAQEAGETRELIGMLGGRAALMTLHSNPRADGSARLTGEYLILPTLHQRYLEGERSMQLGVTFLKEGNSPILYGRPGTTTLQGIWSGGVFKGARYAPGGQERERFEFSEKFPDMARYSAEVRCEPGEGRYASTLGYEVQDGRLLRLHWSSRVAPAGHICALQATEQLPFEGGLRFAAGRCRVTLRDLGELVRVSAENCAEHCGSLAYLEPVLVDRGGGCRLLRPQPR